MELEEIIGSIYPVPAEEVAKVAACAELIKIGRGEAIVEQGRRNDHYYFVREGLLRSYCDNDGREDTLWFAVTGDAIGSMHSIYKGLPAISSIEALVRTELYRIPKADMDALFRESKHLANWGYNLAIEELYSLERRYLYIGKGDAYTRFRQFIEMRDAEVIQQIPLKYIAAYLNITPQTLSKLRMKYAKE